MIASTRVNSQSA